MSSQGGLRPSFDDAGLPMIMRVSRTETEGNLGVELTNAAQDLWEDNFGAETPFALGVEEELSWSGTKRVDRQSCSGSSARQNLTGRGRRRALQGDAGGQVGGAGECQALDDLREVRRELLDSGARLMGAAPSQCGARGSGHSQTPRYALIEDSHGVFLTPICGQHIHVGMPDQGTAVRAYNGIRTHIPLINALAPEFTRLFGEDLGLASSRTVIFRSYPPRGDGTGVRRLRSLLPATRQVCAAGDLGGLHPHLVGRAHPSRARND